MDLADGAVPDPLAEDADRLERVPLVAQLRDDVVLFGGLHQRAALVDRMGQGFLAIDVFAAPDGRHGGHGVEVVGRGHHHGVDLLLHRVEHLAEVLELRGVGPAPERVRGAPGIDIAQGHDVLATDRVQVAGPHAPDANARDVQLLVGGRLAALGHGVAGHDRRHGHGGWRRLDQLSTRQGGLLHGFLLGSQTLGQPDDKCPA
ncbi:MAG: hypothetical protein NUV77_23190 [Thermoguttaceae bacterium]|nr:hypothetical protein [Thermoguttaceae bacterium]